MQLFNNKLLRSSVVYVLTLLAIILIFGMWHNYVNKATTQYVYFIILIILVLVFISWLYFTIFKMSQELTNMINSTKQETAEIIEQGDDAEQEQVEVKNFDKDAFIAGVIPLETKDLKEFCSAILQNFAGKLNIVQGIFYIKPNKQETFESIACYAYYSDSNPPVFKTGEGIPGQAVKDNKILIIQNIPENYIPVVSGLGNGKPKNIIIVPVFVENEAVGLIEMAVFSLVEPDMETAFKELSITIGKNLYKLMK